MAAALRNFFKKYIDGTPEKGIVPLEKLHLCNLTNLVAAQLALEAGRSHGVYLYTKALKHLYDKKPAEEFSSILDGLPKIVRYPSHLYQNLSGKRGTYCVVGEHARDSYICSIELILNEISEIEIQVVTAFRKRDEKYLSRYTLLWSREAGTPPS